MSFSHEFHDAVRERLKDAGVTGTRRGQVIEVLYEIIRHLRFQSFECGKVAADLCEICRIDKSNMAKILNLLEEIGAIRRVRKGRLKIIAVNPEAAYRGDVNKHGEVVELYKLKVLDGGRPDPGPDGPAQDSDEDTPPPQR